MKKTNQTPSELTLEQRKLLLMVDQAGCSDDGLYEFCKKHGISYRQADRFLCDIHVPQQCKGCKSVTMYPHLFPCSDCSRRAEDRYEKYEGAKRE